MTTSLRVAAPPAAVPLSIGAITNFFDTLGIGSFATTTAIVRRWGLVADEQIPGTLNVGHALPTITQAIIFTRLVPMDLTTLIAMIASAVFGAWAGAGVVCRLPKRRVQAGMGMALVVAGVLMALTVAKLLPGGGEAMGLTSGALAAGMAGNFVLGALMPLGIGLYAPCMILVALLGMNPTAAFPIMMGSCAFLMPVASLRFIKEKSYAFRAALGLAIGGIFGALYAGLVVKSLELETVKWLVIVVVLYAAVTLLYAATRRDAEAGEKGAAVADARD